MERPSLGLALLVGLLISCGPKKGQWRPGPGDDLPEPDRTVMVPRPEEETTAAGGFRIVVVGDPASRLVELGLRVRTGHIDDPPGKEGLAHLVEHLVFEIRPGGPGTPSVGQRLQAVATGVNATTDLEATHYVAAAPRDLAPRVATILAEIPAHASCERIDRRVFEREREVVRNELHLRGNATSRTLLDALTAAAYDTDHPYRRLSHTSASLDAITWKDVCDFLATHYRPSEMFVVLGGGVLATETRPLVAAFDALKVDAPTSDIAIEELLPVRTNARIKADVDEDLVMLVWPLPARYSPDGVAGHTIAAWLGGALDLAERDGKLGPNRVAVLGGPRAPYMVVLVERGDDSVAAIKKAVASVAYQLWDDFDRDNDFLVTQTAVRAVFDELVLESGRTQFFADYTQFDADGSLSSDVDRLEKLDRDELERITRFMFTEERASIVEVEATDPLAEKNPPLRATVAEPPASTPIPDTLSDEIFQARIEVTSFTLDNGLEVVLAPSYFTPMMQARLVIPGGLADAENPALATFAARALDAPSDGPGTYGNAGNVFRSSLVDVGITVTPYTTIVELSALTGWQDVVVWGMSRLVSAGTYDKARVARLIDRAKDTLPDPSDADEKRRRAIVKAALELSYGADHPVTRRPEFTAQLLDQVDVAKLTAWHAAYHVPTGSKLVVTGNFTPTLLTKHIKEAFGAWKKPGAAKRSQPAQWARPAATTRRIAVVAADETHVFFDARIPTDLRGANGEAAALVAAELLDERVWSVRERLGAAYAIDASVEGGLAPAVIIDGQVDGAAASQVFTVVAKAVADVRGGAFTDEELARASRRAVRTVRASLAVADPSHVLARVRGKDLEYGTALAKAIEAVTGDVGRKAVAAAVAHPEQVLLRGPKPALAAATAALGGPPDRTIE